MPDPVEEICASECLSFALNWRRFVGARKYQLYFDRGEQFCGQVRTRWLHPKGKREVELMQDILNVDESISRHVPALQMADLFA